MAHTPEIAARLMAEEGPANRRMAQIVAATPGLIVSEDMGLLVTAGRDIAFFGFEYTQLARMGLWDQSWELGMLRAASPRWWFWRPAPARTRTATTASRAQFLSELDRSYALSESVGKYRLYRPAPLRRELAPQPDFGRSGGRWHGCRLVTAWTRPAQASRRPGGTLSVSLLWRAARHMDESYTVFVHLLDAAGGKVAQHDGVPFGGIYPTSRWAAGELVRDVHTLQLPADLAAGVPLRVGLYDTATQARLPPAGAGDWRWPRSPSGARPSTRPPGP